MTAYEWPRYSILLEMRTKALLAFLFIDCSSLPGVCIFGYFYLCSIFTLKSVKYYEACLAVG